MYAHYDIKFGNVSTRNENKYVLYTINIYNT